MGKPHRSPYRPSLRSLWLAGSLIACVWALPWMLWLGAPMSAPTLRRAQTPPRVVYVRRTLGESAHWSPVIFALSTRWGFHWTGRTNVTEDMALAGPSTGALAYLEPGPNEAADTVAPWRLLDQPLSSLAGGPTVWAESDGQAFASGRGGSNGVRRTVWISPALELRGFNVNVPRPAVPTNGAPAAWLMAQATVELNSAGVVTHVVLDSPSGQPEWDQALVRALRIGQADAADAPTRGSVRAGVGGP